ncbi:MAG TPA: type II secretion system protein [Candidatus Paceibacterota bacterium]
MKQKGFTLIELLVVIAIIGILAAVVLASLSQSRARGADAAIKANLANARAQAELFYDNATPKSYEGVCATADTAIGALVAQAALNAGATFSADDATAGALGVAQCHDSASAWAAAVPLKSTPSSYYCSDNAGASKTVTTPLAANTFVCPLS